MTTRSMRLAASTIIAGCLCLGAGAALAQTAATTGTPASQTAAQVFNHARIVLGNLGQTYYSYETDGGLPNVSYNATSGKYDVDTDCSGWISYLLGGSATANYNGFYAFLQNYMGTFKRNNPGYGSGDNYPQAFVYAAGFKLLQTQPTAIPGFAAVTDLRTIQPGDIIAWCGTTFCNGVASKGDTGHVMLAIGPAQQVAVNCSTVTAANKNMCDSIVPTALGSNKASLPGAVWAVEVADESCLSHYSTSNAWGNKLNTVGWPSNRTFNTPVCQAVAGGNPRNLGGGVGTGFIFFTVNGSGVPLQHQFAAGDPFFPPYVAGSDVATFTTQAVGQTTIGRLVDVTSTVN